jgi:hypothetical protein
MALPSDADIPLILSRLRPGAEFGWKGDGDYSNPANIDWRDTVQSQPTLSELETEWTVILTEEGTKDTVRQQLKTAYATIAGIPYSDLTNAELRTMSEIHSYILGGIDEETRLLRPASQWGVAKELLKA